MTTTGFLALISLKKVLQQPGCPICRLSQETETRYVNNLLREHVNDVGTRRLISQSMGFCPQHGWLMYRLETERFGVPLGNAIISEDLIDDVLRRLDAVSLALDKAAKQHRWQQILGQLHHWLPVRRNHEIQQSLKASAECSVCQWQREIVKSYVITLVSTLTQPEHQKLYATSDGICLPHLRLALELAAPGAGLQNLLDVTGMRLSALQENLGEFDRKQSWQHKRETVSAAERAATRQAVAFFAGKESILHDANN